MYLHNGNISIRRFHPGTRKATHLNISTQAGKIGIYIPAVSSRSMRIRQQPTSSSSCPVCRGQSTMVTRNPPLTHPPKTANGGHGGTIPFSAASSALPSIIPPLSSFLRELPSPMKINKSKPRPDQHVPQPSAMDNGPGRPRVAWPVQCSAVPQRERERICMSHGATWTTSSVRGEGELGLSRFTSMAIRDSPRSGGEYITLCPYM